METAYRKPKRTLRRKLALHRVRLTLLQRRLDRTLERLSMDRRGDVDLARQRLEDAIDDAPTAKLEGLILAYDEALVSALDETDSERQRRSTVVWQLATAVLLVAMLIAAFGPSL
jgi:hypothetical protein